MDKITAQFNRKNKQDKIFKIQFAKEIKAWQHIKNAIKVIALVGLVILAVLNGNK